MLGTAWTLLGIRRKRLVLPGIGAWEAIAARQRTALQ